MRCAVARWRRSRRRSSWRVAETRNTQIGLAEGETAAAAPRIGVLALQGDFREHVDTLRALGVEAFEVRTLAQLEQADGLILPGGESTTIARLLIAFDLLEPLRARIRAGLPVWGTCAGAILLAKRVPALDRPPIGAMDVTVDRNAFGRQIDSFEEDLHVTGVEGGPIHAVFIRAPVIRQPGKGVEVLCTLKDGRIVAVRQGRLLATSFHPELTEDHRMHELFVRMVQAAIVAGPEDATPPPRRRPRKSAGATA